MINDIIKPLFPVSWDQLNAPQNKAENKNE